MRGPGLLGALGIVICLAIGTLGCQAVSSIEASGQDDPSGLSEADGDLPQSATVFDEDLPGIANLSPDLLSALRQATTDAADDGIEIQVNSGWRSTAYQNRIFEQAIDEHGSEEEAVRWAATAKTSFHVSGEAVDIAPYDAIDWLSRYGDAYGLCQIYGNESWHYEFRAGAPERGCPPMYPDPTHDPRMQQ